MRGPPRIIHQIWFDWGAPTPCDESLKFMNRWRELHPGWEYSLWGESEALEFVRAEAPEFLDFYTDLRLGIQRCDVFRLIVLLVRGGMYVDVDIEPLKCMEGTRATFDLVLVQSVNSPRRAISNYMIMASARHPFIAEVLNRMARAHPHPRTGLAWLSTNFFIIESTGPGAIDRVARERPDLLGPRSRQLPPEITASRGFLRSVPKANPHRLMDHRSHACWVQFRGCHERWLFFVAPLVVTVAACLCIPFVIKLNRSRNTAPAHFQVLLGSFYLATVVACVLLIVAVHFYEDDADLLPAQLLLAVSILAPLAFWGPVITAAAFPRLWRGLLFAFCPAWALFVVTLFLIILHHRLEPT